MDTAGLVRHAPCQKEGSKGTTKPSFLVIKDCIGSSHQVKSFSVGKSIYDLRPRLQNRGARHGGEARFVAVTNPMKRNGYSNTGKWYLPVIYSDG
jgi:hypothetical protein